MYDKVLRFLTEHWFSLIQTGGIIFSILWGAHLNNLGKRTEKVSNYLLLTQCHRDVWKIIIDHPKYYDSIFVKQSEKLSTEEKQFLTFVFLHMTCTFELIKNKQITDIEALRLDIGELMTSKAVSNRWKDIQKYYNQDFINFIQDCKEYYVKECVVPSEQKIKPKKVIMT
jgi:hypothetical protein